MSDHDIDEILEIIWMHNEKGENDLCVVQDEIKNGRLHDALAEMETNGLVKLVDGKVSFTPDGEKQASNLLRRHRLAERLLIDVLDTKKDELESTACEFEHILSEEVTDAICTLLGHPKFCPHGLAIPPGNCCKQAQKLIESVITGLDNIDIGQWVTVAYILAHQHPRLHKLMSFGIAPGVKIKVHQKSPSYVIQVAETQIALEEDIVKDIFVRR